MQIQIDSREKAKAISKILDSFKKNNIDCFVSKLYVGDYVSLDNSRLVIDRKQNLREVYSNVCHQHKRFIAELIRANEAGIKVIILCEHGGEIKTLEDVKKWNNPQLYKNPYAWDGIRLYKTIRTISDKYNAEFMFCKKNETGQRIIELLKGGSSV